MKGSLRRRSLGTILLTIFMAFVIGLLFCTIFATRFYANAKQQNMKKIYTLISQLYGDADSDLSQGGNSYRDLALLCEENTISLFIMDSSGNTEFSYGNDYYLRNRLFDIIFTNNAEASIISEDDNYTIQTIQSQTDQGKMQRYIEIWGYLPNGSFFIGRSSYSGISNSVSVSMMYFCIVAVGIFIIAGLFAFLVMKPYTDSIDRMMKFAKAANEGDFNGEINKAGKKPRKDELGVLGENISEMSHKLEKTISELKTSNLRLQNELKEKQAQEEARKKYMSDVSHELKTPIAIISGYAEGLKEGVSTDPEDIAYYCDVIIDESEKMNLMIKKLATLNQLEQGRSEVSLERFDVVAAIDGFLNTMNMVIEENQAQIYFSNKDSIYVWSDEFLFEEVLMNFFNNAIHHLNDKKIIRINAEHYSNDKVRITVFNSGENIAEEEIDKIWEKFYKVDKARTREYGGSGLGLSIVKAVADSLGQECGVYNLEDGVAFWIDLESASGGDKGEEKEVPEKKVKHKLTELPVWKAATGAIKNATKKTSKKEEETDNAGDNE